LLAHIPADRPYAGQRVALLTQHGKEQVIAPVLAAAVGCRVERIDGYDTDQLGTFTREIPRAGTQIEAARRKARMGMTLAGLPLGLASEGASGPDPMTGLLPWGVEVLLFVDDEQGFEVLASAEGRAQHAHRLVTRWDEVEAFAREAGFPEHHLVLRPQTADDPRIVKGLHDWDALEAAFAYAHDIASDGGVFIENDLRAYANPTRMALIRRAAEDLAARLGSTCPDCDAPGFWPVDQLRGLPCADCGAPTREARAQVLGCVRCSCRRERELPGAGLADPGRCDYCNP